MATTSALVVGVHPSKARAIAQHTIRHAPRRRSVDDVDGRSHHLMAAAITAVLITAALSARPAVELGAELADVD